MRSAAEAAGALQQQRDAVLEPAAQKDRQRNAANAGRSPDAAVSLAKLRQELAVERTRAAGLERSLAQETDEAECLRRGVLLAAPSGGHSTFTAQVNVQTAHTRTFAHFGSALRGLACPLL
jgi:hypothetical protein